MALVLPAQIRVYVRRDSDRVRHVGESAVFSSVAGIQLLHRARRGSVINGSDASKWAARRVAHSQHGG
jgi:hypothetical protein